MGDPRCEIARAAEAVTSPEAGKAWAQVARNSALLGSCPRSLPQVSSGFECWVRFAREVLQRKGSELPPSVDGLLLWSTTFRCRATFCNYLSHLQKACHVARVTDAAASHASLAGAKLAIEKRSGWSAQPRMAVRTLLLEQLLERPGALPEAGGLGFLFAAAYTFLLRLPSEALVIQRAASLTDASQFRAGLFIDEKTAVPSFARRKNRERRTTIVRKCWCKRSRATCPVHALGAWLNSRPEGDAPWAGWCATSVRSALRAALRHARVGNADAYGTHSFRRGHAQDIVEFGGRVTDILTAGDWQMPAWMRYLDVEKMERQAVAEAHFGASSSDDEPGEADPPASSDATMRTVGAVAVAPGPSRARSRAYGTPVAPSRAAVLRPFLCRALGASGPAGAAGSLGQRSASAPGSTAVGMAPMCFGLRPGAPATSVV